MPFLRITRDKRGYENTCLMHTTRGRGKEAARILYWFRSPPDVRVGRGPFDDEAIRLIEETHPGVHFDWAQMLRTASAGKQPVKAKTEGGRRGQKPSGRREASKAAAPVQGPIAPSSKPGTSMIAPEPAEPKEGEPLHEGGGAGAAEALLGHGGLARLRARYAELVARIGQRVKDPARQSELRAEAALLDPDTWATDEDVRLRLETFEACFEAVRAKLGHRRRRSRRGGAARRRRRGLSHESGESSDRNVAVPPEDRKPES